ncbi:sensor histidine kinase [Mariniradius sediminis]|uniref:Histidine kinase n=1 Tax=Mariniradius sediminis TaxID=2909237 RepID=A0ABS9BXS1_9BACT|nr:histidine kinase [Mariniradius sediminis]MCF1752089.1 histidine kinase [Mariniradius sediminis]
MWHLHLPGLDGSKFFWFPPMLFLQSSAVSQSEFKTLVIFALFPVLIAFSFLIFVFYRSRREAVFREKETELQLQKTEVALKALKAQINPHFIFNCLNSIHHYMYQHPVQEAGNYLLKFSQQIRYVLESSEVKMVPLADEIEANKNYLELEQLRVNHAFGFKFVVDPTLDTESIHIPPMLIQPFLENAVWHGVAGGGEIEINISQWDDWHLLCQIQDSGNGGHFENDFDLKTKVKKTSLGMSLMKERFAMLNQMNGKNAGFSIEERTDGISGKIVKLRIPFED